MKGTISICRRTGRDTSIVISIRDKASGCEFLEAVMSPEVFGNAVTGLSEVECEFELRPDKVGKTREVKTEQISFHGSNYETRIEEAKAALKPFETDGWKGNASDLLNRHRNLGGNIYRVTFIRFVEPTGDAK